MIAFDYRYYRPRRPEEAAASYRAEEEAGRTVRYGGGNTELSSMARQGKITFDALIDLKEVEAASVIATEAGTARIGAAATLNQVIEAFPGSLLAAVLGETADHTVRNQITIGGNIAGRLPYREGVLPFLLCDTEALLCHRSGELSVVAFRELFKNRLLLEPGSFLLQLRVPLDQVYRPYRRLRRTATGSSGYPLMHLVGVPAGAEGDASWSLAAAGLFSAPRLWTWSGAAAPSGGPWPSPLQNDVWGSGEYRGHLLQHTLQRWAAAGRPETPRREPFRGGEGVPPAAPFPRGGYSGLEPLLFYVNGREYRRTVPPRFSLLDFLRDELGLTAPKTGCENGDCGACTVRLQGRPVKSCLVPVGSAAGREVETWDYLAETALGRAIRQAFFEEGGAQCGFCTAGFMQKVYALLEKSRDPGEEEIETFLGSNLCRCTGYEGIRRSVARAVKLTADE